MGQRDRGVARGYGFIAPHMPQHAQQRHFILRRVILRCRVTRIIKSERPMSCIQNGANDLLQAVRNSKPECFAPIFNGFTVRAAP